MREIKSNRKMHFQSILICMVIVLFSTCRNKTYNYNNGIPPTGISYSYYKYGTGTSFSDGAFVVNIHSNSTSTYNEYYIVNIYGVGTYVMQPGTVQLFLPNVWPNYYDFTVEKVCAVNNNTGCYPRTLTGNATITAETTTVADTWL